MDRSEVYEIIRAYGEAVDYQGWEIEELDEAVDKIINE